MKEIFMQILLTVSYFQGAFPAQIPWAKPSRLKFSYLHPSFFINLAVTFFFLLIIADMLYSNPPKMFTSHGSTYNTIIYYSRTLSILTISSFYRLTGIFVCSSTIKLFRNLCVIQDKLRTSFLSAPLHHAKLKYIFLIIASVLLLAFSFVTGIREAKSGLYNAVNYTPLSSTVFAGNMSVFTIVVCLLGIVNMGTVIVTLLQVLTFGLWLTETQNWIYMTLLLKVQYFSDVGDQMAVAHMRDKIWMKGTAETKNVAEIAVLQKQNIRESWEMIQTLKIAYETYSKVAGWYLLETIVTAMVCLTGGVSKLIEDPTHLVGGLDVFIVGISISTLCIALGESMKNA
ncbi:unnamed protein product, partial [Allacma fusca]